MHMCVILLALQGCPEFNKASNQLLQAGITLRNEFPLFGGEKVGVAGDGDLRFRV